MRKLLYTLVGMAAIVMCCMLVANVASANEDPTVTLKAPANEAFMENSVELRWTGEDADSDPLTYDVYFDTNVDPVTKVAEDIAEDDYTLEAQETGMTYYWKVVAKDGTSENMSETWEFTIENSDPEFELVNPEEGDTVTSFYDTLVWDCLDPDNDTITYQVYFDTNADPTTLVATDPGGKFYPDVLLPSTTYYWKVIANDTKVEVTSDTYSFSTAATLTDIAGSPNDYGDYGTSFGQKEDIPPGGTVYAFEMKKDDKLEVNLYELTYTTDFYLVEAKESRKWIWAEEGDTIESIPVGTKMNANSIKYEFKAPEDGVYCVIIDDSEMGNTPIADYVFDQEMKYDISLSEPEEDLALPMNGENIAIFCLLFVAVQMTLRVTKKRD